MAIRDSGKIKWQHFDERNTLVNLSDYLAKKFQSTIHEEAASARILRELIRNQRA